MIGTKRVKYSKLFTFEADLIHVPDSRNRKGIDPWPRFWLRPSKLIEYRNFSRNPSSINNGYTKDESINLYVKNIDFIDTDTVDSQFVYIKNQPPYGFITESDYESFVITNFESSVSASFEAEFLAGKNKIYKKASEDETINRDHYIVKVERTEIFEFYNEKLIETGVPKSLTIVNNV